MRKPDFSELLKVLNKKAPSRPVLFEFFLNEPLYIAIAGEEVSSIRDEWRHARLQLVSYEKIGYDYVTVIPSDFHFPAGEITRVKSISLNETSLIHDWQTFEQYKWLEPEDFENRRLNWVAANMPDGMRAVLHGPGGVLENVIRIMGYDNTCFALMDDPELVRQVADNVGSRLCRFYQAAVEHPGVGAIISNDDWGFNRQTMISPADLRKYIFPWHKKIVEIAHKAGKPAILHSCGFFTEIEDDVIDGIGFDAKHSFEDNIMPIEQAYERYAGRIALLGGIDLDFVCRRTPAEIRERCAGMLRRAMERGGWALGTGNSVPDFVPHENYLAMVETIKQY